MSNLIVNNIASGSEKADSQSSCKLVEKIIPPKIKDLGGFTVKRILPATSQQKIGPWIFFDHMGPVDFPKGQGINVRPHPHINLATVTYTFSGEIWHRDSLGNSCAIRPGELNLMVAGKGITHSERTCREILESGQRLDGLQLWMALPIDMEEIAPDFLHYKEQDLPKLIINDVNIRLMIGEAYGEKSPVKQFASTLYFEARLKKNQSFTLPFSEERAAYTVKGSVKIGIEKIKAHHLVVLRKDKEIIVEALEDSFIVIIGGESLGKRYMEWNFVSSQKERIEQAKKDWRENKFPKVKGDTEEFIPYH